jgi:hypothetical protein
MALLSAQTISMATNDWQEDYVGERKSYIAKPVDPVIINLNGYDGYVNEASIGIPLGKSWDLIYNLEAGLRYHVFLVGTWICNDTTPRTDYDILTIYPDSKERWNTESAGIPEQVAFDENHHYFVPPKTGNYNFRIINDVRDSTDTEGATFMVIEHIDLNKEYSRYLEGREYNPLSSDYEEVEMTSWAYEFNTKAPKIRVFVDVPDMDHEPSRGDLDMYEVRLYAMANPDIGVGYLVDDIAIPSGDLFTQFNNEYGGYNSSCNGERNIDAMASCEYPGADMEFTYETPNGVNGTSDIFYFLAVIAEHGEGVVNFYVQTDFNAPNITSVEPPEIAYAGYKTELKAYVLDDIQISRVWMKFTDDEGRTWGEEDFTLRGEEYVAHLPTFSAGKYVNYTIFAMDKFENKGSISSGLLVKEKVTIDCDVSENAVKPGDMAVISGTVSLPSVPLVITLKNGLFNETIEIMTDTYGEFEYQYSPKQPGEWIVQVLYYGDELTTTTASTAVTFRKEPLVIECDLADKTVRGKQKAEVIGSISLSSTNINLVFTNGDFSKTHTITTDEGGNFRFSFTPNRLGNWILQVFFEGSETELPAESEKVTFSMESKPTQISAFLSSSQVKKSRLLTLSGAVTPAESSIPIEILFVSSSSYHSENVYTEGDGTFNYEFKPAEEGEWSLIAKAGDGLVYSISQSDIMEYAVLPLNFLDRILLSLNLMLVPPYLYAIAGLGGVGVIAVVFIFREKLLPSSTGKGTKKNSKKKNNKSGGTHRYRRVKK